MRQSLIAGGVGLAIGAVLALTLRPAKVATHTEVRYKDRIVEKVVEHRVVVQTETKKPDGTDVIQTVTKEDTATDTKSDLKGQSDSTKTVEYSKGLSVGALVGLGLSSGLPVYGAYLNKQVLGPIQAGAFGLSNGTVGLSLGVQF